MKAEVKAEMKAFSDPHNSSLPIKTFRIKMTSDRALLNLKLSTLDPIAAVDIIARSIYIKTINPKKAD